MRPRRVAGNVVGSELGNSPQRCNQLQAWPQSTPTLANIQKQLLRRLDADADAEDIEADAVVVVVAVIVVAAVVADSAGNNTAAFYDFLSCSAARDAAEACPEHLEPRDFFTRKQVRNSMGDGTFWRLSSELESVGV